MSIITNGVSAQTTSTTKINATKIEQSDSIRIMHAICKNRQLDEDDVDIIKTLLHYHNTPIEGCIAEDGIFLDETKYGDEWMAYISSYRGSFYLTYLITRNEEKKFVGRLDIRIN